MNKAPPLNYLETAHRNIAWFNDRHKAGELQMRAPFQRNPVWTNSQKSYLIDTILRGLPVPELYMQDVVDENGQQEYVIVDGQQRTRACLEFIEGDFSLDESHSPEWGGITFDELSPDDKKRFFGYKFVVRTLPDLPEPALRDIFQRLNRNVVALNAQELRHATYWGPFIHTVEAEAEENGFWAASGVFTATEIKRMLDVEFISELVVAHLHGVQEKKKRLDYFYQRYEEEFEDSGRVRDVFRSVTGEITALLPELKGSRWRKKSDFYSLFHVLAERAESLPLPSEGRERVRGALIEFARQVDEVLRLDDEERSSTWPANVVRYARAVSRAASDLQNRKTRSEVLSSLLDSAVAQESLWEDAVPADHMEAEED